MSNRRKEIELPHYIDHEEKIVYLHVTSWVAAMAAQTLVDKYHPGYQAKVSSLDVIAELKNEQL